MFITRGAKAEEELRKAKALAWERVLVEVQGIDVMRVRARCDGR